jgi:hypothetical protein
MLYGLSSFCMPNLCCNCTEISSNAIPSKLCQMLRKTCPEFSVVRPSISVQVRTDYTDFPHPEKRAQQPPRFLCLKWMYGSLGKRANTPKKSCCCSPRNLCTLMAVRPFKSILYGLFFIAVCCLVIHACCLPWDACLSSCKCCLSSQSSTLLSRSL